MISPARPFLLTFPLLFTSFKDLEFCHFHVNVVSTNLASLFGSWNLDYWKFKISSVFQCQDIFSLKENQLWRKDRKNKPGSRENKPDEKNYKLQDRAKICNFYNPDNRNKHEKTAIKVFWLNRE